MKRCFDWAADNSSAQAKALGGRRAALAAVVALLAACGTPPVATTDVLAVRRPALPGSATDPAWANVPMFSAPLVPQDMVDPRLMQPSTARVEVQAVTDGRAIAWRLRWQDASRDDLPGAARFGDACAVQVPAAPGPDVPAPQMGEAGRPVEISYWSAFAQATADGRPHEITALYPNANVDHYPFQAAPLAPGSEAQRAAELRYAPARALGNTLAGPGTRVVQDLVAEGPGTLAPAKESRSSGGGEHDGQVWAVQIARPLPAGIEAGTQVAFAVWQGATQEVGARKMRSVWVPLRVEVRP